MCLLIVFLWRNSRFGRFNSLLADQNSRLGLLREFADNVLIWLTVFLAKWQFRCPISENSRLYGNNRECGPALRCQAVPWDAVLAGFRVRGFVWDALVRIGADSRN